MVKKAMPGQRLKINNSMEIASLVEYRKVMAFVKSVEVGELKTSRNFVLKGQMKWRVVLLGFIRNLNHIC